jgi:hypothetical protein
MGAFLRIYKYTQTLRLSYERRISTIRELIDYARSLEPDAGIRVKKDSSYFFIGRNDSGFMVVEAQLEGDRLVTKTVRKINDERQLRIYFEKNFKEPLDAVAY